MIKKYRKGIAVAGCTMMLAFFNGCGAFIEGLAEGGKDLKQFNPQENHIHVHVDDSDPNWRLRRATEDLKRIEEQQRLEGYLIREHTRKMLKKMELERKMRELERPR